MDEVLCWLLCATFLPAAGVGVAAVRAAVLYSPL